MLRNETYKIQQDLADYCRGKQLPGIPGVNAKRLAHYRRLIGNVIYDVLETAYPITHQILNDEEWRYVVDEFFRNHRIQSAQIWKMPFEFYLYALQNETARKLHRPYLNDLLYFEWLEIEVHTMPDADLPEYSAHLAFNDQAPVFNPDYKILELEYPVHRTETSKLEAQKGRYFLLVYREQKDFSVQFMEVTEFFAALYKKISQEKLSAKDLLREISLLFDGETATAVEQARTFLINLNEQGLLLGNEGKEN